MDNPATTDKPKESMSWYQVLEKDAPWLFFPPILVYVSGYAATYGYYDAFGMSWLISEMPSVKYLEFSFYPLTTFAVAVLLTFGFAKPESEKFWKAVTRILYFLIYGFTAWFVFASFFRSYDQELCSHMIAFDTVATLWYLVPSIYAMCFYYKKPIPIDKATQLYSVIFMIVGFVFVPLRTGLALGYDRTQAGGPFDYVSWVDKKNEELHNAPLIYMHDNIYYVFDEHRISIADVVEYAYGKPPEVDPKDTKRIRYLYTKTHNVRIVPVDREDVLSITPSVRSDEPRMLIPLKPFKKKDEEDKSDKVKAAKNEGKKDEVKKDETKTDQ